MRIGLLADPHLISPDDPNEGRRDERRQFVEGWPSFVAVVEALNERAVDQVIILGDLIDYYSPENVRFALDLLEDLDMPWALTPGNHDVQRVRANDDGISLTVDRAGMKPKWTEAGVNLDNRTLDFDGLRCILLDSADSSLPSGSTRWLRDALDTDRTCVLCTHVPIDVPPVVEAIHAVDSNRDLNKYVQRGAPDLYEEVLYGSVSMVCSGHLHFPASATIGGLTQHIMPRCTRAVGSSSPREGTITILGTEDPTELSQFRTDPIE